MITDEIRNLLQLQSCRNGMIIVDNARSHINSVTGSVEQLPPLRPYSKTVGIAKRKRMQLRSMDRWNPIVSSSSMSVSSTPIMIHNTTNTTTSTERPYINTNANTSNCLLFSPMKNTSPSTTPTTLRDVLCGFRSTNHYYYDDLSNSSTTKTTDMELHQFQTDLSPRLVKRIPSSDGIMMLDDSNRTDPQYNKDNKKKCSATSSPRRPVRKQSVIAPLDDDNDDDNRNTSSHKTMIPSSKNICDSSPRKPDRRRLSITNLTSINTSSSSTSTATTTTNHYSNNYNDKNITFTTTMPSSPNKNKSTKTAQFLLEALTISNLCDCNDDNNNNNNNNGMLVDVLSSSSNTSGNSSSSSSTSSDDSTVDSLPSTTSSNTTNDENNHHHHQYYNLHQHLDHNNSTATSVTKNSHNKHHHRIEEQMI